MTEIPFSICIVTQPERTRTEKTHAGDLAEIVEEITSVVILTANIPSNSKMYEDHEVVLYGSKGLGQSILTEILRFAVYQVRICQHLYSREEDVILFFGTTSYLLPVLFSRLIGKTVVLEPRGNVPLSLRLRWEDRLPNVLASSLASLVKFIEGLNYRMAHAIITYTPSMARELGLRRFQHKLYTDGARYIDTSKFCVETPFKQRGNKVGYVGRLDAEKRIPVIVEAVKNLPPGIEFLFVGDGDYREMLEKKLEDEIQGGKVEVLGWVDRDKIPEYLNQLKLILVPSHPTEGLPTAILEGMACGTPAYATPVSGVPDVVLEGETGFLMQDLVPEGIAADIEKILEDEELTQVSENARNLVTENYSFQAAVDRYTKILRNLTD